MGLSLWRASCRRLFGTCIKKTRDDPRKTPTVAAPPTPTRTDRPCPALSARLIRLKRQPSETTRPSTACRCDAKHPDTQGARYMPPAGKTPRSAAPVPEGTLPRGCLKRHRAQQVALCAPDTPNNTYRLVDREKIGFCLYRVKVFFLFEWFFSLQEEFISPAPPILLKGTRPARPPVPAGTRCAGAP